MKGAFFSHELQWLIETQGESWFQGDKLKGVLMIKNPGHQEIKLDGTGVSLGWGEIKKIQSKEQGAIKILEKKETPNNKLLPGEEIKMDFCFQLSDNAPVSDKRFSMYLCFGKNYLESHLQLLLLPYPLFSKVSFLLETFYRFKLKETKASRATDNFEVELKFSPPTSREMATIESLNLYLSKKEDKLVMRFEFQIKKLDLTASTTKFKKEKKILEKELPPKDYSLGRELINQDGIMKALDEIFSHLQ